MKGFTSFLERYLQPIGSKIAANKFMAAIRDGFVYTLPFTLTGSIFLLIAAFPIPAYSDFMTSSGFADYMYLASDVTFGLIALLVVLGISYHLALSNKSDAFVVSILSLICFVILLPNFISLEEHAEVVTGVIPRVYLGAQGLFTAMFIGLIVPTLYSKFSTERFTIKMPPGVPPAIAKSFASVIPVLFVITIFWLFQVLFIHFTEFNTINDLIYTFIQIPLQSIGDTFIGMIIVILVSNLLWFFGLHGSTIVMGIMSPIYQSNSMANLELYKAGELTLDNGAYIVTQNFLDSFVNNGGSGMTIGLVAIFAFTVFFRSQRLKEIGKLSFVPGIFTINEPVLFGMPVILNPMLLIPFILAPVAAGVITYTAIVTGIMQPLNGIVIPWTTPPIISGYLVSGIMGSIVQIINIIVATLIWLPFIKILDKEYVENDEKVGNDE